MFQVNIPQPYLAKAQEIMEMFSVEVKDNYDHILNDYLQAVASGADGNLRIQAVTFGKQGNTERDLQTNQLLGVKTVLEKDDTALMLSNKEGAVFCLSYVLVGDKEYLQFLNPQAAMAIKNEQEALLKELEAPKELSFYEKICDFFARHFRNRPGEAAARAEAYRTFYENMQKNVDKLGSLTQTRTAQSYDPAKFVRNRTQTTEVQTTEVQTTADVAPQNPSHQADTQEQEKKESEDVLRKEEELKRQAEIQQRNEALKVQYEHIQSQKDIIKSCQLQLDKLKPEYNKLKSFVETKQQEKSALDMHKIRGPRERAQMKQERDSWAKKLEAVEKKIQANEKKKDFDKNKDAAEKKLEQKKKAWEDAKNRLEDIEGDLRSVQIEFSYTGYLGYSNGTWSSPAAVLEKQYQHEKAISDERFAKEQLMRDEKMQKQQRQIELKELDISDFKKAHSYFSRTAEQKQRLRDMENELSEARKLYKQLTQEKKQAQKDYEEKDIAKQKELLHPTEERLKQTEEQLKQVKDHYQKVKNKHDAIANHYDLLKNTVPDLEKEYNQALRNYNKKYIEKPDRYDANLHESLSQDKTRYGKNIEDLDRQIANHDAITNNWDQLMKDVLDVLVPKELKFLELDKQIRLTQGKMERAKAAIAKEEERFRKNDPNEQKDGIGISGL